MRLKKLQEKGFTIVELVIVIAVIAILAAVLVPTFSGFIERAKESSDMELAKNVSTNYLATLNYAKERINEQNYYVLSGNHVYVVKEGTLNTQYVETVTLIGDNAVTKVLKVEQNGSYKMYKFGTSGDATFNALDYDAETKTWTLTLN